MSPVAPSGNNHVGRAAAVALVGIIVLAIALGLATLAFRNTNSPELGLGDQVFQAGRTDRLAAEIADRGPIFYGDVSGRRDRDIILQHLGSKEAKGWYAFQASPVNKDRSCTWQWQAKEKQFRAKCDRSLTAPANGEGLPQYKVTVGNGRIEVDLNADARATTTSSTSSTSSSTSSSSTSTTTTTAPG